MVRNTISKEMENDCSVHTTKKNGDKKVRGKLVGWGEWRQAAGCPCTIVLLYKNNSLNSILNAL